VSVALVDSHCHLQHFAGEELAAVLDRARERGVREFLVPAVRLDEAETLLDMAEHEAGIWCALGVHPHDADSWRGGPDRRRLQELLAHPAVVAVGECGLDFYYDHAERAVQERVFREQVEIALDASLPVVIHNRDSNETMTAVLSDPAYASLRADLHSFAGGKEMAAALVPLGHYFGVSGMVTFPRATNVREALPAIPRERLLVETDTPYLAPVPHRGKRNEPAYVAEVAARLAEELGEELETVARRAEGAFRALFPRTAGGGAS